MEQQNELNLFIDSLMTQAGVSFTNEDDKNALRQDLTQSLQERIGVEAINMLDDEGKADYLKFMETPKQDVEIQEFFMNKIENFQLKMQEVVMGFAKEFVEEYKK